MTRARLRPRRARPVRRRLAAWEHEVLAWTDADLARIAWKERLHAEIWRLPAPDGRNVCNPQTIEAAIARLEAAGDIRPPGC